jgi:Clathrin light chain
MIFFEKISLLSLHCALWFFFFLPYVRTAEQVFLETIYTDIDVQNTWDRVSKLIDASMDKADSVDSNKADVTRMIFIQLKNEPVVGN